MPTGRRKRESDAPEEKKKRGSGPTRYMRVPARLGEMLDALAQHGMNGWGSVAAILDDPECPLYAWLAPLYDRMILEKQQFAKEAKKPRD